MTILSFFTNKSSNFSNFELSNVFKLSIFEFKLRWLHQKIECSCKFCRRSLSWSRRATFQLDIQCTASESRKQVPCWTSICPERNMSSKLTTSALSLLQLSMDIPWISSFWRPKAQPDCGLTYRNHLASCSSLTSATDFCRIFLPEFGTESSFGALSWTWRFRWWKLQNHFQRSARVHSNPRLLHRTWDLRSSRSSRQRSWRIFCQSNLKLWWRKQSAEAQEPWVGSFLKIQSQLQSKKLWKLFIKFPRFDNDFEFPEKNLLIRIVGTEIIWFLLIKNFPND